MALDSVDAILREVDLELSGAQDYLSSSKLTRAKLGRSVEKGRHRDSIGSTDSLNLDLDMKGGEVFRSSRDMEVHAADAASVEKTHKKVSALIEKAAKSHENLEVIESNLKSQFTSLSTSEDSYQQLLREKERMTVLMEAAAASDISTATVSSSMQYNLEYEELVRQKQRLNNINAGLFTPMEPLALSSMAIPKPLTSAEGYVPSVVSLSSPFAERGRRDSGIDLDATEAKVFASNFDMDTFDTMYGEMDADIHSTLKAIEVHTAMPSAVSAFRSPRNSLADLDAAVGKEQRGK